MPIYPDMAPYLFHEGTNSKCYEYFGAHPVGEEWIFRVWAPTAAAVSVVGDFCNRDRHAHPMKYTDGGIWEATLSGIKPHDRYQYCIRTHDGRELYKVDPFAFYVAARPDPASEIFDLSGFPWRDGKWMQERPLIPPYQKPLNIYRLSAESLRQGDSFLTYKELAERFIPYIRKMNYTHIELPPLTQYPHDRCAGDQVTGYFAPTARCGTPYELMYFVDACHRANIGVIMDWVPTHFSARAHGLCTFDGTPCYESVVQPPGSDESCVFDYGKAEVLSFLQSSAQFWLEVYHLDGLRLTPMDRMLYPKDGQPDLQAVEFLKRLNIRVHAQNEGIMMIAEESTVWPMVTAPVHTGGLGFDLKWNTGWRSDTLRYMSVEPALRGQHVNLMTFSLTYAFSENFILPPPEQQQPFAGLRAYYAFMLGHPGKKMLPAEGPKENISLQTVSERYVADLNKLYLKHGALSTPLPAWQGFQWIAADDTERSVLSFRLTDGKEEIICIFNFSDSNWDNYSFGVPYRGNYKLILSSDDAAYGGKSESPTLLTADRKAPMHGQKQSITLDLPPLSALFYVHKIYQNKNKS